MEKQEVFEMDGVKIRIATVKDAKNSWKSILLM